MTPPLLIKSARVVTLAGPIAARRGSAMSELAIRPNADVLIDSGLIRAVDADLAAPAGARIIHAGGRVVMPGFIDCHTHACFAGDRLDEWDQKRRGVPYLDILKAGGGIMSTVRATRAASQLELAELLRARLDRMLRAGATTIEVKSGYGLGTEHELTMLRAIADAAKTFPGTIVPTALIAHALDPSIPRDLFVRTTIHETLPAITREFPGIAIDAYCEDGAWSVAECTELFTAAALAGHPIRVHADQFNALGMIDACAQLRHAVRTVDHLEATTEAGRAALAALPAIGVLLPCTGLHTDGRYADGRALVRAGAAVAVASNFNPGTSPCSSVALAAALSVRTNRLEPAEAITAITVNAAAALGLSDRGVITPGARADLVILRHRDERDLVYEFGLDAVDAVIARGELVRGS